MQNTQVGLAILISLAVVTAIQLIYYYIIYGKFTFHRKKSAISLREIPISVVIVVRDNASQILQSLPKFLNQQYPDFEVVIVNDRSPDEQSLFAIKEYQQRCPKIKFVDLSDAVSTSRGKKMALSFGIKCASHEHVVITSPDCEPTSEHWLLNVAQNFQGQKRIVIGYSTFARRKNPYNLFLHYDNVVTAVQYFSSVLGKSTYRGDFRNVAFVRSLFYKQKGFTSFNHLEWGEDDVFIHRISDANNTAIEFSPDSTIVEQNIPQYGYWRSHKISLFYTRKYNSSKNRVSLAIYEISNILFYTLLVLSIIANVANPVYLYSAIGIAVVRVASLYVTLGISASKLNEKQIIPHILFYDILFSILNPLYWLFSKINRKKIAKW